MDSGELKGLGLLFLLLVVFPAVYPQHQVRESTWKSPPLPPPPPHRGRSWMRILIPPLSSLQTPCPHNPPPSPSPLPPLALEGRAGGAGGAGRADGDVIRVRWVSGVRGGVRASVRGQRGRGHGQAREATGRLRPQGCCCCCCC